MNSFLSKYQKQIYSKDFTHVSISNPKGVFSIPLNKMEKFWDLYHSEIQNFNKIHLAEKQGNESPILVDIDLKLEEKKFLNLNKETIYSQEQIHQIIKIYFEVILEVIDIQNNKNDILYCVVLEKKISKTIINNITFYKNGFHLHFPKIFVNRKIQEVYIYPKIKNLLKNIFPYENILDDGVVNVPWLLYGSSKHNSEPYLLTQVFKYNFKTKNIFKVSLDRLLNHYIFNNYSNRENSLYEKSQEKPQDFLISEMLSIFLYDRHQYFFKPKATVTTPLLENFENI